MSPAATRLLGRLLSPLTGLLDLIHPLTCSLCAELLDGPEAPICPTCRFGFDPLAEPLCDRCGLPLGSRSACSECLRTPLPLIQIRSAFAYGGPVQQAVLALKRSGRRELGDYLADQLVATNWPGFRFQAIELLVPVPLHRRRLIERGFNQSVLLAGRLAHRLHLGMRPDTLRRTRPGAFQTSPTSRAARWDNVQAAFEVKRPRLVAGRAVCLVDDVVTTGATLSACTRVLLAAGARSVRAVTLARTLPA